MTEWTDARTAVLSDMTENPGRKRSVFCRPRRSGGYAAMIATRTPDGIVTGILEFDQQTGIAVAVYAALEALEQGADPAATIRAARAHEQKILSYPTESPDDRRNTTQGRTAARHAKTS